MSLDIKEKLHNEFGRGIFKKSALRLSDCRFVSDILKNHNAVLEIGTFRGVMAVFMSQYCDVITIDIKGQPEVNDVFRFSTKDIKQVLIRDDIEKADIIKGLTFDIAFIDGDHTKPEVDFSLVKHCGNVIFHDYSDNFIDEKNYVFNFVNTLDNVIVGENFAYWHA